MSKIGRRPIVLHTAEVKIDGNRLVIKGPKGQHEHDIPKGVLVTHEDKRLHISVSGDSAKERALWGLHRALIANKVQGVEQGFERKMKIVGLGYKAQVSGKKVTLTLGYSHKIDMELPEGVKMEVDKTGQQLTLSSTDKFILGNICDAIRSKRPPEPYKGTGVMYADEILQRKAGKTKS